MFRGAVLDVVLVLGVLDRRLVRTVTLVMMIVAAVVVLGLEHKEQHQHFNEHRGHHRQHDQYFDFRQYDTQHAGEHRSGRGQVALETPALCNRKTHPVNIITRRILFVAVVQSPLPLFQYYIQGNRPRLRFELFRN